MKRMSQKRIKGKPIMSECIFCKIASGEMNADIVYRDDKVVAFRDIAPQAPVHVIIIPADHVERIEAVKNYDIFGEIFRAINVIIKDDATGAFKQGFRVVSIPAGPADKRSIICIFIFCPGVRCCGLRDSFLYVKFAKREGYF